MANYMRRKTEPTEAEIVDFYYWLLILYSRYNCFFYKLYDEDFNKGDSDIYNYFTLSVDDVFNTWPRETSPEIYERFVSQMFIRSLLENEACLNTNIMKESGVITKHKIKITIEE